MDKKDKVTDAIEKMIALKHEIDKANRGFAMNMISYDCWSADAVELLLQLELNRQR